MNKLVFPVVLLILAGGALLYRATRLQTRPMHADEAVQAFIAKDLWLKGTYRYNPNEYHGPTMPYIAAASLRLSGVRDLGETTEASFRWIPVLFGAGMILLLWLLEDALGKPAVLVAGLLTAISPAMVYYSRYFIHETLFVFFTLAAMATGWRYVRSGRLAWCLASGACIGLMQATKETSVLVYAAAGVALLATWAGTRLWRNQKKEENAARVNGTASDTSLPGSTACSEPDSVQSSDGPTDSPPKLRAVHILAGMLVAGLVAILLLSSLLTNWQGPIDGVRTYLPWIRRAGGESAHLFPWYHYLHILGYWRWDDDRWTSEGLILFLAAVGLFAGLSVFPKRCLAGVNVVFVRWLGCYSILLATIYAVIPYKTPWCLLGFLHGFILLAGIGAVVLVRLMPSPLLKVATILVLLLPTSHLAWQSYQVSFALAHDPASPYAYVPTLPDMQRLTDDLCALAEAAPEGKKTIIKVIWHDGYYWPLPWYLRRFPNVGYWDRMPPDPTAPIVISSPPLDEELTAKLDETHLMTSFYGMRPNVFGMLWVRLDVWEAHLRKLGRID